MLANLVTFFRLVFGLLMIIFSYLGNVSYFIIFYSLALLTDILDGFIARKLKSVTEFGAKFDALADNFIVICVAMSFYFINRNLLIKYAYLALFLIVYFVFIQFLSLIFTKSLFFMRNYAALLAAIVFPIVIFSSFLFESRILIYAYVIITIYSLTEKLFLKMTHAKKSVFMLKSKKIKLLFILVIAILITIMFFIPLLDTQDRVCFEDGYCITVEVKDTAEERALGLMFRESLDEDQGMLFIFDSADRYTFWMKNMKIPIDIIFLNSDKEIVHITHNAKPCFEDPCELYAPDEAALYVVEVKAGFSERHNLEEGEMVGFD